MKHVLLLVLLSNFNVFSQTNIAKEKWVNERLNSLTLNEKIGQLFIIRAYGKQDSLHIQNIERQIKEHFVGGLCFFQGDAEIQGKLTNYYQSISNTPLFISMDAEWSLGMRLKKDGFSYPKQMCLGAIRDNHLIFQMGQDIGNHLSRIGVNFNFAPVVDINSNPNNPVINERSFGEDKLNVTSKSYAFMLGLQSQNILSCAKHFPGHGDTDKDSHFDLPIINLSRQRLDSIELFPFKVLCEQNIPSIMVGHLLIPTLDSTTNISSSQSRKIVFDILRKEYHYKGLVVTDALEMKAVSKKYLPGELEVASLKAGNDVLLLSENIDSAIAKIKIAIANGELSIVEIEESVKRILNAKYDAHLSQRIEIENENLLKDINPKKSYALKDKLYRNAISLIKDNYVDVPIRNLEQNIVSISIGSEDINAFQKKLSKYTRVQNFNYSNFNGKDPSENSYIQSADLIIVSLHNLNYKVEKSYGLNKEEINFITQLSQKKKVILCVFGAPYVCAQFKYVSAIVLAYENNKMVQDITAELMFGSDPIHGVLPVNISGELKIGKSIKRPSLLRLGYTIPESEGMNSDSLINIALLAHQLIEEKAAPGCQILIAKNNKIIYDESFGNFTYDSSSLVNNNTLFDLASLTKIFASAPSLIKLSDEGKLDINDSISKYLPEFIGTNKQGLIIKDALLHQAKLLSWIPFYKSTLISPDTLNILNPKYYRDQYSDSFAIQVTPNLFLLNTYKDSIYNTILSSKLHDSLRYLYSDLFFYFVPKLVERITGMDFEKYIENNFYKPLGMNSTFYLPLEHGIDIKEIAPSENDTYFRHQEIQACVHDMGSAMCGGISGHAGLFSNAENLAILLQCYLNNGNYGGLEYFSNSIIKKFTSRDKLLNRRALIFDLPEELNSETAYVSNLAPKLTFGHTGFTGTCVWADPVNNIIYIFLSNRTYPNSTKNILHKQRYRVKIQDIIYKSMIN
ncbi:MAG: glycoside hydrolase family 3 N-terminal domain-containing protein [Saprospiraceae bacterium]